MSVLLVLTMIFGLTTCGSTRNEPKSQKTIGPPATEGKAKAGSPASSETARESKGIKIKVTVGEHVLTATLIDNATTRSLIAKFPLTVPMQNLYYRESIVFF